jgi:hypothetical protein
MTESLAVLTAMSGFVALCLGALTGSQTGSLAQVLVSGTGPSTKDPLFDPATD